MKLLHIFGELKPSGGEAMMLSAAPMWLKGTEMYILSTGEEVGVYSSKLASVGYKIEHIQFRKSLKFFIELIKLMRKEQFDAVHLHTERASLWFAISARLALGFRVIVIRTVHHIFKFNGWLRIRKIIERLLMRHIFKVVIVSNSPSGKKNEIERYFSNNILIPNWYDSNSYQPPDGGVKELYRKQLGYSENTCVFLSLGGNWYYKNYSMIVEALALIPHDLNVLYVQVGYQGNLAPLETLANEIGVSERLCCMGVVEDPKIYLHAADVYIMPSSEEGFGVAAVEAMACGLPVILSDVEALCDFKEFVPGIEYIIPTPFEIASAMIKLSKLTSADREHIGADIAMAAKNNYGLGCGAKGYLSLYDFLAINN